MAQIMLSGISTTCKIEISPQTNVEIFLKNEQPKLALKFGNSKLTLDWYQFEQLISVSDKIEIGVLMVTNRLKISELPRIQPEPISDIKAISGL